jgi:RNA polymerase sigma factor (sigma-70 family)
VLDTVSISPDRSVPVAMVGVSVLAQPAASRASAAAPVSRPAEPTGPSAWIAMVFDELGSRIQGMILAATRDAEVAADLTQEAFLRLLREAQADRYPDKPSAWLYRTAMNLAISRSRRVAVARRLAPRLVCGDEAPMPEGIVLDRERWRAVSEALSHLSPTERTALLMAGQGMSGEEIAARLGMSHGATRSLMFRARGRLRRLLEGPDRT